jgi:hypothetical protein
MAGSSFVLLLYHAFILCDQIVNIFLKPPCLCHQVRLQTGEVFAGTVEDVDVRSDLATIRYLPYLLYTVPCSVPDL